MQLSYGFFFHKNESLRTISNHFLASLSVEDFLVGLDRSCMDHYQVLDSAARSQYLVGDFI